MTLKMYLTTILLPSERNLNPEIQLQPKKVPPTCHCDLYKNSQAIARLTISPALGADSSTQVWAGIIMNVIVPDMLA